MADTSRLLELQRQLCRLKEGLELSEEVIHLNALQVSNNPKNLPRKLDALRESLTDLGDFFMNSSKEIEKESEELLKIVNVDSSSSFSYEDSMRKDFLKTINEMRAIVYPDAVVMTDLSEATEDLRNGLIRLKKNSLIF